MAIVPNLLLLFQLVQSAGPESSPPLAQPPDGGLVLASDSSCPSTSAVREALAGLRPAADWPAMMVLVRASGHVLAIDLGSHGERQRQLAVGPDCAARAMSAALVIATWMDDLPSEATGAPILRASTMSMPASPPLLHSPAYQEVGAGLSTAMPGGWAPGGHAELIRMRAERGLGWKASLGLAAPRDLWISNGVTHWMRTTVAVGLHARHTTRRLWFAADLGLALAYTTAWGTGYAVNRSDRSVSWGPVAGARAGIPWGRFRLWTELRVWRWFPGERVQIDSGASDNSTSAILPSWEGQWSLGVSYVLP